MSNSIIPMPTPPEIAHTPELAILYLLSEFLEVASRTIIAAHPILFSDERPYRVTLSPDDEAAKHLLTSLHHLDKSIRYQAAITPSPNPNSDPTIANF